jgi:hypothetical protein
MPHTAEERSWIQLAANVVGAYNHRTWMSFFGVPVHVFDMLWQSISGANFARKHLLWTLHFLKIYPTELVGSRTWQISTVTYTNSIRACVMLLKQRLPQVSMSLT